VRARRSVYELLSALYLELPSQKMVNTIFDPDFERGLSSAAPVFETREMREGLKSICSFISSFKNKPREETLKHIAVDRTRLFRGINEKHSPPPPYESVYRDQRLCGKSRTEVCDFYCKLGVILPEAWKESPDYLGIEIDFMRLLCQSQEEAWMNHRFDKVSEFLGVSMKFLEDHLLQWAPQFLERMSEMAELDFYKGLGRLTSGFLKYDLRLVEKQLKEIRSLEEHVRL